MDISKKLMDVRLSKGMTVEQLAEAGKKTVEEVKGWEDGSVVPSASDLIELSHIYNMTMDEMIYNDAGAPEYDNEKGSFGNQGTSGKKKEEKPKTEEAKKTKPSGFTKAEKITLLIFPVLCTVVFVVLGVTMGLWHPAWIVFVMIPIYYIIVFLLKKLGNTAEEAVEEYIDENN